MRITVLLALSLTLSTTHTRADEVPSDLMPFLQYVVQNRAENGLTAVVTDESNPKFGTVYGGAPEDANIAWVAAAAYEYEWSRFHQDAALQPLLGRHAVDCR